MECKCGYFIKPNETVKMNAEYIKCTTITDMVDGYDVYYVISYVYCPNCDRRVVTDTWTKKIGYGKEPK